MMPPPEVAGSVVGAMFLASARSRGVPEPVAVLFALRAAYLGCLAAALMEGEADGR